MTGYLIGATFGTPVRSCAVQLTRAICFTTSMAHPLALQVVALACVAALCGCKNESKQPATAVVEPPGIFESLVNKRVCVGIQFEYGLAIGHNPAMQTVCGVLLRSAPDGLLIVDSKNTTMGIREGSSIVLPITVVRYVCTYDHQPSATTTYQGGENDCFSH